MSIPTFNTSTQVIQQLADRPNDTNGLTAAALKAKFDESSGDIKNFINNTLLPYLESTAAAGDIGVDNTNLSPLTPDTVQEALEDLYTAMQSISQGGISPGSVTSTELATGAVETGNIDNKAVTTAKIADNAVTAAQLALPIYVQATVPTGADSDGIYLVTGS